MAPGPKGATRPTGKNDREILVVMPVAIADASAINNHAVVQQGRSVGFPDCFHLLDDVGHLLGVIPVDAFDLVVLDWVTLMVGKLVMALTDLDLAIGSVAPFVRQHEG